MLHTSQLRDSEPQPAFAISMATDENDDDYFLPLVDQRVFGAGIKRKRIAFVPASRSEAKASEGSNEEKRMGDRYLSLVLKKTDADSTADESRATALTPDTSISMCSICGQMVSPNLDQKSIHDSSIAHQVCLAHSHPPSHLDRSRTGLRYLQEYGWDPDARKGLGAQQEGIPAPVKTKQKNDTTGIGTGSKDDDDTNLKRKRRQVDIQQEVIKLDAKAVREMEVEKSRRAERLRQTFYGEDLSAYLGSAS